MWEAVKKKSNPWVHGIYILIRQWMKLNKWIEKYILCQVMTCAMYGHSKTAENWDESAQVRGKWSFK